MAISKITVSNDDGTESVFVDQASLPVSVEATEVHVTEGEELKIVEDDAAPEVA